MFDFSLTLPFVIVVLLTMMAVLNVLLYSPVTTDMDACNERLLHRSAGATDMLSTGDRMQVEYTDEIHMAREQTASVVEGYCTKAETAMAAQITAASADRNLKAAALKAKLEAEVQAQMMAAEAVIENCKAAFVKATLVGVSL